MPDQRFVVKVKAISDRQAKDVCRTEAVGGRCEVCRIVQRHPHMHRTLFLLMAASLRSVAAPGADAAAHSASQPVDQMHDDHQAEGVGVAISVSENNASRP